LDEAFVTEKIRALAKKCNFVEKAKEHGDPDIVVKHSKYPQYVHKIECKGIQKGEYSKANSSKVFNSALGQITKAMSKKRVNYGIAFPHLEYFEARVIELPPYVRKILNLSFYFVNKRGETFVLTPHANKLKKITKLSQKYG
jgi:hypothetical protein